MKRLLAITLIFCMVFAPLGFARDKLSSDKGHLGNDQWSLTVDGDLVPNENTYNLGSASYYPGTIYLGGVGKSSWGSIVSPWEDSGTTTFLTSAPAKFILTHATGVSSFTGYIAGTADIVLENGQIIDGGTNTKLIFTEASDNFEIEFTTNDISFDASDGGFIFALTDATDGTVDFMTNNDSDDYIQISTTTNQSLINFVGQNGKITAASGTIDFDNENLTTSGTASLGATTVTSVIIGDDVIDVVTDDEMRFASNDNDSTIEAYGFEAKDGIILITADESDDNGDEWELESDHTTNSLLFNNDTTGAMATKLTLSKVGLITTTGDVVIAGTTPKLTLGDGGAEDVILQYDGVVDYYLANDDSSDDLVLGKGSTVATTEFLTFKNDSFIITVGDASAADAGFTIDGAAQDYYIGIDDTDDDLDIGLGGTPGTTPAISIDENQNILIHQNITIEELNFAADGEASDTYVITLAPAPAALTTGMMIIFTATTANTGACTVNVNGLGAKALLSLNNIVPPDSYIEAGSVVMAVYDGTSWQMMQPDANP